MTDTAMRRGRPAAAVRMLAAAALLTTCGTFVAAEIDFYRRHRPHLPPEAYWRPHLLQIWLPGLTASLLLLVLALVARRRSAAP